MESSADYGGEIMNNEIKDLISKYEVKGDFNYANVTDEMLCSAEKELGVNLPDQFKEYVKTFGYGGIGGIGILGVGLDGSIVFKDTTQDYRKEGLPDNLVVIENVDEWLECIDCNTGKIVSWDTSGYLKEDFDCFDEYLLSQMNDAIENL